MHGKNLFNCCWRHICIRTLMRVTACVCLFAFMCSVDVGLFIVHCSIITCTAGSAVLVQPTTVNTYKYYLLLAAYEWRYSATFSHILYNISSCSAGDFNAFFLRIFKLATSHLTAVSSALVVVAIFIVGILPLTTRSCGIWIMFKRRDCLPQTCHITSSRCH